MPTTITDSNPLPTPSEVAAFEREIGHELPAPYRDFLLRYNGGIPEPSHFRWGDDAYADSSVQTLFGLVGDDPLALRGTRRRMQVEERRVPAAYLPVGTDPGGNLILLGLDGDVRGKVFFWDHEQEPAEEDEDGEGNAPPEPSDVNISFVADDFGAFLDGLHERPVTAIDEIFHCLSVDDMDAMERLFDSGVSPDTYLPLHRKNLLELSAFYHNPAFTELLLRKGARENIESALQMAVERKNAASADLIRRAIAEGPPAL